MKKFTSLLIGCALALAGAALAQQPEEQQSPTTATTTTAPKGKHEHGNKAEATEAQPGSKHEGHGNKAQSMEAQSGANATTPDAAGAKQHGAGKHDRGAAKTSAESSPNAAATSTDATATTGAGATTTDATHGGKHQGADQQRGKGKNARRDNANALPSATPVAAASASAAPSAAASATPVAQASASAAPSATAAASTNASAIPGASVAVTTQQNVGVGANANVGRNGKVKRADPQQLQQIKTQYATFKSQPRPDKVPTVTFTQNYRIQGAEQWQGPQYEVYRSYHPERHDQSYYRSRYQRVELIGGGYYYHNNGYWYPAWGYDQGHEYYAYDAPIYVGRSAEPPDKVIAHVQAELQQMGYYKGEVDGLLGPLTREALTGYQTEQGLTATAVIDEPTLDALGMG